MEAEMRDEAPHDVLGKHESHPVGDRRLYLDAYHPHDEDAPHSLWVSLARLEEGQPVSPKLSGNQRTTANVESAKRMFERLETGSKEHVGNG